MKKSISQNAKAVLEKRYLKQDSSGKVMETPEGLFRRVAANIAKADKIFDQGAKTDETEQDFLKMMTNFWILPNSPTLMNAGRNLGQLAACFVLPIEDSMESIFETLKHTAVIHKSGGGTGFSFSSIRPANDTVMSTAGVSSGPVSFMNVYDVSTETVKQGGRRRGANMAVLRVDHPDIEAFIKSKNNRLKLNNFNLSVGITDKFINALKKNTDYKLINPRTGEKTKTIPAKKIFQKIIDSAWQTGEPGIIFIDEINRYNPTPQLGKIEATNPCGEQPLLPYESCTLGSINLSKMVIKNSININRLKKTVHNAVHFLDNVIEINKYPILSIEKKSKATRKIGLGVMGFADMLIKLKIPYDSPGAVAQAEGVMSIISKESKNASAELAKKRGNFPAYNKSIYNNPQTPFMRNATTTTIAPTGTLSIIADTSSGIEPLFAVAFKRHVLDNETLYEIHTLFAREAKKKGIYTNKIIEEISKTGSLQSSDHIPDNLKKLFVTSHDISARDHINIQGAFQKFTDNAVSKTINFPSAASKNDIKKAYIYAFEKKCKGITVYRYGSREKQVLEINKTAVYNNKIKNRPGEKISHTLTEQIKTGSAICPECCGPLIHEKGCILCHGCGWSKCS